MKKIFSIFLVVMFLMPVYLGAAGEQEQEEEVIELEIWFGREDFVPKDEFKQFHEENPNIRVNWTVVPLEQAHSDFIRNHAANRAPDVVQIFSEFMATLVVQDTLYDIGDLVSEWEENDPEDFNDLFDIVFDSTTFDGETYGMNVQTHPFFLGYRSDWLDETGLDPPETWEDVIEISRDLQSDYLTGEQYAFAHPGGNHHPPRWMNGIFMSMGAEFTETGLPIVDAPAGIALIEFYQTLAREELQHPDTHTWASGDYRGAFMTDRAAFYNTQIHIFNATADELEYGDEFMTMVEPYREGAKDDHKVGSFGCPYMVSSETEHPEAVMKLLQYIADPEILKQVTLDYSPSARESVMSSDEYVSENPFYEDLAEGFEKQVAFPSHVRSQEVNDILNEMKGAAQREINRNPEDIAREYQEKLNALEE